MFDPPAPRPLAPTALAHFPTVLQVLTAYAQSLTASASSLLDGLAALDPETMPAQVLGESLQAVRLFFIHHLNRTVHIAFALDQLFEPPAEPDWVQLDAWDIEDEAAPTD
jgi:hypothetical protein